MKVRQNLEKINDEFTNVPYKQYKKVKKVQNKLDKVMLATQNEQKAIFKISDLANG